MLEAFKDAPFLNRRITAADLPNNVGRLVGFQEDKSKLVRSWGFLTNGPYYEDQLDFYTQDFNRWQRFTEQSGIKIPNPLPVFGERSIGSNICMFYVVVDKVEGVNLRNYFFEDKSEADLRLINQLFGNLADYAALIYQQGGDFLSDQKLEQYVIGTTARSQARDIYFVDLDREHGTYNIANRKDSNNFCFFEFVGRISLMMSLLEAQCGRVKFEEARDRFARFLDSIPDSDPFSNTRIGFRARLEK